MEIILTDKIKNLGDIGDLVKVRPGYARNYLIPYGHAKFATEENRLEVEQRRIEYEKQVSEERGLAKERADKLKDLELTHVAQAMEDGQLYGAVSATTISDLILQNCQVEIHKQEINFPEGQIRTTGSHTVMLSLHSDVQLQIKLQVIAAQRPGGNKEKEPAASEPAASEPAASEPAATDNLESQPASVNQEADGN